MEFNLAALHEAIAAAVPDRECLVWRDRRLSYADVTSRTRRLASFLRGRGLGLRRERTEIAGSESGQDHLALYLYNCNEYLEGMLGAFKARLAPVNVNYRYVEEELVYLLRDAGARGIVYHAEFAPKLEKIRPELPELELLVQVADESGHPLLPGAIDYEEALASASAERPDLEWSPDDLYILYTGGTTGMPKGVLWRQADVFVAALGGRKPDGSEFASVEEVVERARGGGQRSLPAPPFMHGAAHWVSFINWLAGHTVVVQPQVRHLDPDDIWSTCDREKINALLIIGDAFARPLLDRLREGSYDLSALRAIASGGAILSASYKKEFLERLPQILILDSIGSSESGGQGQQVSTRDSGATSGSFQPGPDTVILSEDLRRVLPPGHEGLGWFAKRGRVPLGYFGDPGKTARTFPTVDGVRYTVPGDRARQLTDGVMEVLGRDSVTINSGGEKIFAEEVEHALKHHAAVYDAVVVGRPSERWGQEVVAIVKLREGKRASDADLLEECSRHIARYKLPKAFLFLDEIVRSPSGKADYRWARAQVTGG
jgi:acyl-CoA synthetase (AMP-forming)/AMP-acid ligase II